MPSQLRRLVLLAVLAALLVGLDVSSTAMADDAERERIFLVYDGEDAESLERETLKFESPILQSERFELAGTQEMEVLYASCGEEIGVDAETRRDCQLRAANRIMVTQILELSGSKLDNGVWDVALVVWSPETNGKVWGETMEVEAKSLRRAAREALPELADRYLCWRGIDSACPGAAVATTAPVDTPLTDSTTPTPVETAPARPTPVEATPSAETVEVPQGMVHVPGGVFTMGSTSDERDAAIAVCQSEGAGCSSSSFGDEERRDVDVPGFFIDEFEVTVDAYSACVDAGSCTEPDLDACSGGHQSWNWGADGRGDHPINCVAWQQAVDYCTWSDKRLPTEEEWEKAARGTDGRIYPWGDSHPSRAGRVGNLADTDDDWPSAVADYDDDHRRTAPVGTYLDGASPFGAYDMAGNVWEWTSTTHEGGSERVFRGGSYVGHAAVVRAAVRADASPSVARADLGFRCARSASP